MNIPLPESAPEPVSKTGPHDFLIDILGDRFFITAGEDPSYLEEVLGQYQFAVAQTQGISGIKDPLRIAILTGFLLCDESNKMKKQVQEDQANAEAQRAEDEQELYQITENLIARLDQIIEKEHPFDG